MSTPLQKKVDQLNFACKKWRRYHERRSGFYSHCNFWMKLGIIVFATTPLYGQSDNQEWILFLPVVASLIAVFDIVWRPSHLARDHHDMYVAFSELESEIETTPPHERERMYMEWIRKRGEVEKGAKSRYRALEAYCHNEVARVTKKRKPVSITWWQQLTMNCRQHAQGAFTVNT